MSGRQWVAIVVLLIVSNAGTHFIDKQEADSSIHVGYLNQIAACQSGNVIREVQYETNRLGARSRRNSAKSAVGGLRRENLFLAKRFDHGADRIAAVPFANPDGSRRCQEAIREP